MARLSFSFKSFLLILSLGAAGLPAQELEMIAPPLPSVVPSPPPDPDTLPAPPAREWAPLSPSAPADQSSAPAPLPVPPPQAEVELPPPEVAPAAVVAGGSTGAEKGTEEVEVWREESESPQMPARQGARFDKAYIAGVEPVLVRLQFDPLLAGKTVIVLPGPGVTAYPAEPEYQLDAAGECVVSVALNGTFNRSNLTVYCDGFRTTLPLSRASLAVVEQQEALTGGGE